MSQHSIVIPIFDRFSIFWIFEVSRIDDYFLGLLFLFKFADKEKICIWSLSRISILAKATYNSIVQKGARVSFLTSFD